jgi:xylose isomerase
VKQALEAAGVGELSQPTLGDSETHQQLLGDRSALEDYDLEPARTRGYGFAHIQRLALEHLLGIR